MYSGPVEDSMEQEELDRWVFVLTAAGLVIAVVEFLVISLLVGKGTIVGFQNGLLSGAGVVAVAVVLTWLASIKFRSRQAKPEPAKT